MIDNNLQSAYEDLSRAFSQLTTEDKRKEILNKINEMAEILNKIDPIDDIKSTDTNYTSEDEYLCCLNSRIYNFENKIGNIFKDITQ